MRYRMIRTENLTRLNGSRGSVRDISLEVEPGEVYGFLGPDGSGKTTFVKLLLDQMRPTSGRALVMGLESSRHGKEIRRKVGYVPATQSLLKQLNSAEMLHFLARLQGGVSEGVIDRLLERFRVDRSKPISALGRSQQRRLAIVQAFMHDSNLIILDEPTLGLDLEGQKEFYQLVREARNEDRTVFLTSCSLAEMERICDRVAVVHHGQLIAVERGVQLRARAYRKVEMRFASQVALEAFTQLPNLQDIHLNDNSLTCIVRGDPDRLIKIASQFQVTDFISLSPSLEEAYHQYYGLGQTTGLS